VDWITDDVAIGNFREALDAAFLKQHGFRSALSLEGTLSELHAAQLGLSEVTGDGQYHRPACWPAPPSRRNPSRLKLDTGPLG
jgi:hypothetical protein